MLAAKPSEHGSSACLLAPKDCAVAHVGPALVLHIFQVGAFWSLPQLELVEWDMHFFFGIKQRLMHHDASCLCARDVLEYLLAMVFGIDIPGKSINVNLQKKLCQNSKRNSFKRFQTNLQLTPGCISPTLMCLFCRRASSALLADNTLLTWMSVLEEASACMGAMPCKSSANFPAICCKSSNPFGSLPAFSLLRRCRQTLTHSRPKAPTVWLSADLEATYRAQASLRTCLRCWLAQVPKKKLTLQEGIKPKNC